VSVLVYSVYLLDKKLVAITEKTTTVTELRGIRIAAKTGDNKPDTAKINPTILYKKEMVKFTYTIFTQLFANFIK
jgi:hypothetical protein